MGVAAAREALQGTAREQISSLHFATATSPFSEPPGASLIHAALRLAPGCRAQDVSGASRSGLLALQQALEHDEEALVVAADRPATLAGSTAESRSGDGGAAALVSRHGELLRYLGGASVTAPFVDRYRTPHQPAVQEWEERWVREEGFLVLVPAAIKAALAKTGLQPAQIDHFVLPCSIPGCTGAVAKAAELTKARLAESLLESCGDMGSCHALAMLASVVESAAPGQRVLVAEFGQGASALIFEAGRSTAPATHSITQKLADGLIEENYTKLLAFNGLLPWDRGLRGRVSVNEALTTAFRNADAILGFVGGRCRETGQVQFPPSRLSAAGGFHLDTQDPWPLADLGGRVETCTADLLAFSRHPPNCYGLVDINGGGRLMMDFSDPDAAALGPGDAVRFEFRVKDLDERTGYRRYFWKAVASRPSAAPATQADFERR
jgi:3-hydroxy-3-methylglutaryl CoA synthase